MVLNSIKNDNIMNINITPKTLVNLRSEFKRA